MFKFIVSQGHNILIGTQRKPQQKESKKIIKSNPNLGFWRTFEISITHSMLHTITMGLPMLSMDCWFLENFM